MQSLFVDALVIGCGATLVMDFVALVLKRAFGLQPLDYGLVGRWIHWRLRGEGVPRPISQVPPFRYERPIGWLLHYLIGVVFALVFLMSMGTGWAAAPSLLPALAFGVLTVAAPFFVLQPAFGAGVAARRTAPAGHRARQEPHGSLELRVGHLAGRGALGIAQVSDRAAPCSGCSERRRVALSAMGRQR